MILPRSGVDNHVVCRFTGLSASELAKGGGVKLMLGIEDTRCKFFGIVASKDRHRRLRQNWTFTLPFCRFFPDCIPISGRSMRV